MDQQPVPDRSLIGVFYSSLLKLATDDLNIINIKEHPKWARRLIDAERKRRKNSGDTAPSKAEKRRIISFGGGETIDTTNSNAPTSNSNAPTSNSNAPTSNSNAPTSNSNAPTSNSNAPTEAASTKKKKAKKKRRPPARSEIDGQPLHEHVAKNLAYSVSYDKRLDPSHERSLAVFGTFQCQRFNCRNHWVSGICATVLEFSRTSMKYRTTIHSQQCRNCLEFAEPKLDEESYAYKIKWVMDLWTGNREVVERRLREGPDGPHEDELCHACDVGKCPWQKREQ